MVQRLNLIVYQLLLILISEQNNSIFSTKYSVFSTLSQHHYGNSSMSVLSSVDKNLPKSG